MNKEIQNDEKVFVNRVISILAEQKTVQLDSVRNVLDLVLNDYDVKLRECSLAIIDTDSRTRIIQNFLVAKKVEGRADSSLRQYNYQLVQFFGIIDKKPVFMRGLSIFPTDFLFGILNDIIINAQYSTAEKLHSKRTVFL